MLNLNLIGLTWVTWVVDDKVGGTKEKVDGGGFGVVEVVVVLVVGMVVEEVGCKV